MEWIQEGIGCEEALESTFYMLFDWLSGMNIVKDSKVALLFWMFEIIKMLHIVAVWRVMQDNNMSSFLTNT